MNALAGWMAAGAVLLAAVLPITAQTAADARFETGVTNIHVDARAVYQGKSILNLTKDDFAIRDEGQVRPILSFQEATVPLDLVLVLDAAWANPIDNDTVKNARRTAVIVANALKQVRPFDRTAVISFALDPRVEQDLTSDQKLLEAAVQRIPLSRETNPDQYLALRWAARLLEADSKAFGFGPSATPGVRKRAVLIVTADKQIVGITPSVEQLSEQFWGLDIALNVVVLDTPHYGLPEDEARLVPSTVARRRLDGSGDGRRGHHPPPQGRS
jgi:hypothetical protein